MACLTKQKYPATSILELPMEQGYAAVIEYIAGRYQRGSLPLKDAAATAVCGADWRANGVLIITTNR